MENWYYADAERQRQGPLTADELAQRFHQGRLRLDTLVWRDGMAEWQPLRDFTDELALHQTPAETFYTPVEPAATGAAASPAAQVFGESSETAAGVGSPYAPPSAALTSDEAFYAGGEVVYAGFWKRVAASFIDGLVVGVGSWIVAMVVVMIFFGMGAMGGFASGDSSAMGGGMILVQLGSNLLTIAMSAAYYAGFHASGAQATLGKMAVGIKVVRTDGSRITIGRGVGRYFATWISYIILGIGFLMAAFTERKQGLHDMICDTLVVDKWAFTAHPEWQKRELGTVTVVILVIFGVLFLFLGLIVAFALVGIAGSMR